MDSTAATRRPEEAVEVVPGDKIPLHKSPHSRHKLGSNLSARLCLLLQHMIQRSRPSLDCTLLRQTDHGTTLVSE